MKLLWSSLTIFVSSIILQIKFWKIFIKKTLVFSFYCLGMVTKNQCTSFIDRKILQLIAIFGVDWQQYKCSLIFVIFLSFSFFCSQCFSRNGCSNQKTYFWTLFAAHNYFRVRFWGLPDFPAECHFNEFFQMLKNSKCQQMLSNGNLCSQIQQILANVNKR